MPPIKKTEKFEKQEFVSVTELMNMDLTSVGYKPNLQRLKLKPLAEIEEQDDVQQKKSRKKQRTKSMF